jgi:hypothetical protein
VQSGWRQAPASLQFRKQSLNLNIAIHARKALASTVEGEYFRSWLFA